MLEKAVPYLKVAIVLLVVALLVLAAGLVRYVLLGGSGAGAPRSELERAVFAAEEAVRANPQDAGARVKLAAAYLEQNSVSSAIEQAEFAIRLAPKDPSGYYVLGLAQSESGDLKGAAGNLKKAAGLKGQLGDFYADVYAALATVQEKDGDLKGAIKTMGKALDQAPENAVYLTTRGRMHEDAREWVWALDDYLSALQYVPDYEPAGEAYNRLSREHPEALKKLKEMEKANKKAQTKSK